MQPSRLVKMPATERLPKGGVIALLTPSHQYIFWTDWTLQKIWKMAPWDELPDLMAEYDRQVSQVHLRSCCFRRIYMTTQTRTRQAEWKTLRICLSTVANCNNLVKPFTHIFWFLEVHVLVSSAWCVSSSPSARKPAVPCMRGKQIFWLIHSKSPSLHLLLSAPPFWSRPLWRTSQPSGRMTMVLPHYRGCWGHEPTTMPRQAAFGPLLEHSSSWDLSWRAVVFCARIQRMDFEANLAASFTDFTWMHSAQSKKFLTLRWYTMRKIKPTSSGGHQSAANMLPPKFR